MIEFSNIFFSYENSEDYVLKNINFKIEKGECILLCGKSGCGKSSLLNMINGIIPHHIKGKVEGEMRVDGKRNLKETIQDISEYVGSAFQNPKSQFFHLNTTDEIQFGKGKATAITGHNGSGKSTLAHCLCGLKRAKNLYYDGKKYNEKQRQKKFNLVFQDVNHQLFADSVMEEMRLGCQLKNRADVIKKVLTELDLHDLEGRHPLSLSGGQKQRLVVGTNVVSERQVLIFDEPTSGLDYVHMRQVSKLINDLKKKNIVIIVITHDDEFIQSCCDQRVCMNPKVA